MDWWKCRASTAAGAPGSKGDRVPDFDDGVGGAEKTTPAKTSPYFRQRGRLGQRSYFSGSQCLLLNSDVADRPIERVPEVVAESADEQILSIHLRKAGSGIGTGMH